MNTSPSSQWFYSENGEQKGPISFSELQGLITQGLPLSSLVWTEGTPEWVSASSIPELTPALDPSNPYAAPITDASLAPVINTEGIPEESIPLDIGFCIGQGWKHTFANFGSIVLLGLVYIGIAIGLSIVTTLIETAAVAGSSSTLQYDPSNPEGFSDGAARFSAVSLVLEIISQIITLFLSLGVTKIGLDLLKGQPGQIGDIFSQGDKLIQAIIASILFWLMLIIGLFLLIVPGIIVAIRFGYYQTAIVEKNLSGIDALKYSWNLTRGNSWPLCALAVLVFFIIIAGMLALLVGLVIAIPLFWLTQLISYRYLHAGPQGIKVLS